MTPTPATDSVAPSPRRAAGDDGSYRPGSSPVGPLPRRLLLRRAGALAAAVTVTTACGVRWGEGSPASLPTVPASEAVRDALARQATLIASTAQVVARSDAQQSTQAEAIAAAARTQLEALGGVWDPWATPVPTTYQTVSPAPSAAADVDVDDLVSALAEGWGRRVRRRPPARMPRRLACTPPWRWRGRFRHAPSARTRWRWMAAASPP
ncbi:hypothetical protein [Actinomyces ruminis]|uniref:hypothetical protein n=1 Tax=Actinomyces ruminis TaxID=1937003 RepID=UPI00211E1342|nr:hypothetical protein [Actinomyces ruminis]